MLNAANPAFVEAASTKKEKKRAQLKRVEVCFLCGVVLYLALGTQVLSARRFSLGCKF